MRIGKKLKVHRGQGLSKQEFQQLTNTKDELLSCNNFLSTNTIGVLFIITINPKKISAKTTLFDLINEYSTIPQEQEILVTMHTVFRVVDMKHPSSNSRRWKIKLMLKGDKDSQLAVLSRRMKEEIDDKGWYRMGK
ncbi:unnamed protein product [Rotaria magnacalcarata]|uniref:Uncharacterized protein n=1 Tax=Rotaria magnacalcarata TaxID=392030 RepID=A0A8S2WA84_9BILA|nr:unnamed protein product [Rotaria magnacalcarata]CAF4055864.1 unnamed protein product [Rotaria magnacalcarata]CAF4431635.1 unnamed protein product [Rotaria magnacalcarata]